VEERNGRKYRGKVKQENIVCLRNHLHSVSVDDDTLKSVSRMTLKMAHLCRQLYI
jgi:hypothetical protein